MKKLKFLLLAVLIGSQAYADKPHGDSDTGLLDKVTCRKFSDHGLSKAHVEGAGEIQMRADFGSIYLSGAGWTFGTDTIVGSSMDLNGSLTVVGSKGSQLYALDFTKSIHGRHEQLCLTSVRAIPEIATSALLLGLAAFAFTSTRRK